MASKIHIDGNFRKTEIIAAVVIITVLFFLISWCIIAYTPVRNLIPGYPDEKERIEAQENVIKLDSLEHCLYRWELYSRNLRNILEGAAPVKIDSLTKQANREIALKDAGDLAKSDSTLRAKIEAGKQSAIIAGAGGKEVIEGIHFFKPLDGVVINPFEPVHHPAIEISAPESSPVKSVLDGNVIYTNWSEDDKWCMVIQHTGGIVSVYRHNHSLMKKAGDPVNAGTVIGMPGKGDNNVSYISLELWEKGLPVDPAIYISF